MCKTVEAQRIAWLPCPTAYACTPRVSFDRNRAMILPVTARYIFYISKVIKGDTTIQMLYHPRILKNNVEHFHKIINLIVAEIADPCLLNVSARDSHAGETCQLD